VRQTQIRKHRNRPAAWKQTPLPLDPRDPDIVKAHQLTRNPIPNRRAAEPRMTLPILAMTGKPPD